MRRENENNFNMDYSKTKEDQQAFYQGAIDDINGYLTEIDADDRQELIQTMTDIYETDTRTAEELSDYSREMFEDYFGDKENFDVKEHINTLEEKYDSLEASGYSKEDRDLETKQETNGLNIDQTVDSLREDMGDVRGDDYRFDRIELSMQKSNDEEEFDKLEEKFDVMLEAQRSIDRGENQFEVLDNTVNKIEAMDKEPKTRERDNSQSM